jgi:15-cis-phytoene desaturase
MSARSLALELFMRRGSRRNFLTTLAAASAVQLLPDTSEAAWLPGRKVAVLGGGVGGMSAAHELAERGFDVTVYEKKSIPGGKARSMGVPGSGVGGRRDLPGEHGFRFFPGFYKHVTDTMKRIPYGSRRVFDNLVEASAMSMSLADGRPDMVVPLASLPLSLADVVLGIKLLFGELPQLTPQEITHFASRMLQFMTSCDDRRFGEYEHLSWWQFVDADDFSDEYRKFLAVGLTRNLVAARAEEVNARTVGLILTQFLVGGEALDRVLNGPTNDVWIDPWLAQLQSMGVTYHRNAVVEQIRMSGGRIASVDVRVNGTLQSVTADHYVFALPVERLLPLLNPNVLAAAPQLADLYGMSTAWMNGIQIYLSRDVPIVHGHTIYLDSPWALTSVSQAQFWPKFDLANFGNGAVRGILSVDISNFDAPGILYGKPARECSEQEIFDEVLAQLTTSLNHQGKTVLEPAWIVDWFLDPSLVFLGSGGPTNEEALLINTAGSWDLRPRAKTAIPNMYLAADFVKSNVDLATMEGANEAAREATNAILDRVGSWAPRCFLRKLEEPALFLPAKATDQARWLLGLPHQLA